MATEKIEIYLDGEKIGEFPMADMDAEGHDLNLMMAKAVADVICAEVSFPEPCVPCLLGTLANVVSITLMNGIDPSQYEDALKVIMKDVRNSLARKIAQEARQ